MVDVGAGGQRDDSGDTPTSLCVGIALTTDPGTSRRLLDDFCRSLAAATHIPVTARGMWHYHRLLEALEIGEVDVAWLPPILALHATARRRVIPIALPVRNGVSTYSTALFARENSRIRQIADLAGVRAAWVDRQSAAGYLIIRALLRSKGVDLERAFAADQFLGAHDAVARAVLDGEADVGATFVYMNASGFGGGTPHPGFGGGTPHPGFGGDTPHPGLGAGTPDLGRVRSAGWGGARVHIIAHAGPIPSDVLASSVRLPARVGRMIQRGLVDGGNADIKRTAAALLGAEGFVLPLPEHFEPLTGLLGDLEEPEAAHSLFPRAR